MQRCLYSFFRLFIFLCIASLAHAQTTSITLQVTDAGGQSWSNGTWTAVLVTPPGVSPYGPPFNIAGTSIPVPNQSQSGSLSSIGSATMTLTQNSGIAPANSQWRFVVCSQATATNNCFTQFVTITTVTTVTLTPPALIVIAGPFALAYVDAEISNPLIGASYYNLVSNTERTCNAPAPCTWSGSGTNAGSPFGIASGSAQTQTVTTTGNWSGLTQPCAGCQLVVLAAVPNTGVDPTLAINGGTPIVIKNTGPVQIAQGDFNPSCGYQTLTFDGTFLIEAEPCTQTSGGYPSTGGPANAQTLTITPPITALPKGQPFTMSAGVSNTGPMTLNISSTGAVSVTKCGTVALASGDWLAGSSEVVQFDGTELQLLTPPAAVPCGTPAVTQTLCSGTVVLGTAAVGSAAKGNSATSACSGLATTDAIIIASNAELFGITGFVPSASGILTINCWPTTNTVNCEEENNTSASITPSAVTVNYRVVR